MAQLPPLAAIRVFEAAARHQNYTRAAEELGLTQAGVSYQIKVLEERLGTPLFVRAGKGMALTPAGEALAPRISKAFAELAASFEWLRGDEGSVLSISCSQTIATQLLAPRLGRFQLAQPDIAVRLHVSDKLVDLEGGEFDMAIRFAKDPPHRLESHLLLRVGITPIAGPEFLRTNPPGHAGSIGRPHRVSPQNSWWRSWDESLEVADGEIDQPYRGGALQFDSQVLDAMAAMAGNGYAIVMPPLFARELADGRLLQPFDHIAWLTSSVWLVYPEVRRNSRKVRAFRSWIEQEAKLLLGDDPHGFRKAG